MVELVKVNLNLNGRVWVIPKGFELAFFKEKKGNVLLSLLRIITWFLSVFDHNKKNGKE